ncbi:uncharacterized protein [Ptychodera flava]|uniref:uncharacterized protein n=1 Tax=Ptychodera flava TaxID=63121 RepID=UPI00396A2988
MLVNLIWEFIPRTMFLVLLTITLLDFATVVVSAVPKDHHKHQVLILGAGATGIAAAKYLHENDVTDFVILEGTNRIGGRVKEVQFGGKTIELGANWIQPGDAATNPLVNLSTSLNLQGKKSDWSSSIIRNGTGDDVTAEASKRQEDLGRATDYAYELANEIIDKNLSDMSIRAALRLGGWNPTTPLDKIVEYFEYDFEYAGIPYITSLRSTVTVENGEAIFVTDQRGFAHFLRVMADDFLEDKDPRLQLEKVVQTIAYNDDGVTVTCKDGSTYIGDFAIITFSIGVLQSDTVEFIPELPDWKVEEIFQFDMAMYTKIFLKFPQGTPRFWDSHEYILYCDQRRGYYPVWQNLEADGLFENGTNLLLVTVTGEESRRVEYLNDQEILTEIMITLRKMYGSNIPDAEEIMLERWSRDPLFFGAYSNWPVEVSAECHRRLQANVGPLYFGGEATEPLWNGYVQAGLFTGEREAKKIMRCMEGICEKYTPKVKKAGCTYSGAINFDNEATVDDGSCVFSGHQSNASRNTITVSPFVLCTIVATFFSEMF